MTTTIKIAEETKDRLMSLELAGKGKTFDMLVNDLITFYQSSNKKYNKDYKKWEKSMKGYQQEYGVYKNQKDTWEKLLKWAKSQGFKG